MTPSIFRFVQTCWIATVAILVCHASATDAFAAQVPTAGAWAVRAVDSHSGNPLASVFVSFPGLSESRSTNSQGLAAGPVAVGLIRIVATRLGYADLDTLVVVPDRAGEVVQVRLARSVVGLPPLTVAVERNPTSRDLHRRMFEREVAIGAIGVTQSQLEAVPPVGEPDVFRSLKAFAGVSSVNDYTGELFVRGGGGDQTAVLLDGAPVFAPYHMFGIFGVFNSDAVESTEFYRGSIPARYGGSLSGIVSARQKAGGTAGTQLAGGISMLGARIVAAGVLPLGEVRWMVAGRQASVDVARISAPYSFRDVNLNVEAHPTDAHRLRFSMLASQDNFAWGIFSDRSSSLRSTWGNLASSASWSWVRDNHTTTELTAHYSRYRGDLRVGDVENARRANVTSNFVSSMGVRANALVRGEATGVRAGFAVAGGPVELQGSGGGSYFDGDASRSYLHVSAFAEVELRLGSLRIAPGVRGGLERRTARHFVEPRFSVRYQAPAFAVSASLDRTYQFLSVLRDGHAHAPGAPMWFLHDRGQPSSSADGASVSVDTWRSEDWTASVSGWTRRFRSVPRWHPVRSRSTESLELHDGRTVGFEATVQRHFGRVRGWISYQWARTTLSDKREDAYRPPWDRRHEVDGTLTAEVLGITASLRGTVGSGAPFWFPAGTFDLVRYDPSERDFYGKLTVRHMATNQAGAVTLWSQVQGQLPTYARFDLALRYTLRLGSWQLTPYCSLINIAGRDNVLSYFSVLAPNSSSGGSHADYRLGQQGQLPRFPFVGIDFRFR